MSLLDEIVSELAATPVRCPVAKWVESQTRFSTHDVDELLRSSLDSAQIYRALEKRVTPLPFGERTLRKHRSMLLGQDAEKCVCRS